jgi:hypothetical protein
MILLILAAVILIISLYFAFNGRKDGFAKGFPGPSLKLPLIGHAYLLGDQPLEAVDKMKEKVGSLALTQANS